MVLSGCAPVYTVEYKFGEVSDIKARECIVTCGENRLLCKEDIWRDYQFCNDEHRLEQWRYRQCVWRNADTGKTAYCPRPMALVCIRPDYAACTQDYVRCYESCGGEVERTTRCTANCPDEH